MSQTVRTAWLLVWLLAIAKPVFAQPEATLDLATIDRAIAKEPAYIHEPHYALFVFGKRGAQRSWMVMDGDDLLYFDQNGNGDLTEAEDLKVLDPGARVGFRRRSGSDLAGMHHFPIGAVATYQLAFDAFVYEQEFVPTEELERKGREERQARNWRRGMLVWSGPNHHSSNTTVFLTATRAEAQVIHLDGPATFSANGTSPIHLAPWPQSSHFSLRITMPSLPARGYAHDVHCVIPGFEFPEESHPEAVFEFRSTRPGAEPVRRKVSLTNRRGGQFSTQLTVPRDAALGDAQVTVSYPASQSRTVSPAQFKVVVGRAPDGRAPDVAYVLYRDPDREIGLDEAVTALRLQRLTVVYGRRPDGKEVVVVQQKGQAGIHLALQRGDDVRQFAKSLGENSAFARLMSGCDSRLEITIPAELLRDDREQVSTVYAALQEETGGFLYECWDQKLIPPKGAAVRDR